MVFVGKYLNKHGICQCNECIIVVALVCSSMVQAFVYVFLGKHGITICISLWLLVYVKASLCVQNGVC